MLPSLTFRCVAPRRSYAAVGGVCVDQPCPFRSSSTIAAAMQNPKRLAARSFPLAMAAPARSIAGRSSVSCTTAAAVACERTKVGSGGTLWEQRAIVARQTAA